MKRAGVLLHISSLPNKYGIGSFGKSAYEFVDFLQRVGMAYWQVLPLTITSYGDSPYQSPSAYAGNPYFIDLDILVEEKLLYKSECKAAFYSQGAIDYGSIYLERDTVLSLATSRLDKRDYAQFSAVNKHWLDDYALFAAIKGVEAGISVDKFPLPLRAKDAAAIDSFKRDNGELIEHIKAVQYLFYKQYFALKSYANARGVKIIGDMPIYVAYDSCEVWGSPNLFCLDSQLAPTEVAGVPPDYFSATGQLWGNPLYNWKAMERDGFEFWIQRLAHASNMYDLVRIDHFRGFDKFWAIPYGDKDACRGVWREGGGRKLFDAIKSRLGGLRIIAEDLGLIDDGVRQLVKYCGYPNMKVLQFGFDGSDSAEHLPKNYPNDNCVVYTGTHDNDTLKGFYTALGQSQRRVFNEKTQRRKAESPTWAAIRTVVNSRADTAIIPMQDIMELGSKTRMNTPSVASGNWQWRYNRLPALDKVGALKSLLVDSGRS